MTKQTKEVVSATERGHRRGGTVTPCTSCLNTVWILNVATLLPVCQYYHRHMKASRPPIAAARSLATHPGASETVHAKRDSPAEPSIGLISLLWP
ncbi:hypothetical protein O3P69_003529 [Scylla paramamosain]|uniref:Uncharacterized protein n=1 Tax=Scylla paramamosain TaxID=85552 RepID=A0AAW0UIL5_SCYPA